MPADVLQVEEIDYDDLTEEEVRHLLSGEIIERVIPIEELTDEDLHAMSDNGRSNLEWILFHRPDYIKKYHPSLMH